MAFAQASSFNPCARINRLSSLASSSGLPLTGPEFLYLSPQERHLTQTVLMALAVDLLQKAEDDMLEGQEDLRVAGEMLVLARRLELG
ncbi:MAG: hypothetical protein ACJ74O_18095 [Frankiaceae bacterium]